MIICIVACSALYGIHFLGEGLVGFLILLLSPYGLPNLAPEFDYD